MHPYTRSISSSATLDSQPTQHPPPSPIPDLASSLNTFSIRRICLFFHQVSDRYTLYAAEDVFLGGIVMEEEQREEESHTVSNHPRRYEAGC